MAKTNETTGRKKPGPKPGSKSAARKPAAKPADAPAPGEANPPTSGAPESGGMPASSNAPTGVKDDSSKLATTFKFGLGDHVTIHLSGEKGQIRARAEWLTGNVSYYLAYTSAKGEFREAWIDEDHLSPFVERRAR